MNTTTPPEHQVKVCPYDGVGYFAGCTCGWTGTVHGRKLDASEDGRSHQMMYAWQPQQPITVAPQTAPLLLWNQAVEVLRQDDYKVTQSSQNYATALSRIGLGSPVDEIVNIYPYCSCDICQDVREKADKEYERMDAYREFRDLWRGGGAWE